MRCNRSQNIYIFLILKYNAASLLSTLTLLQWVKGLQHCFSKCSVCMCVPYQPVSQPDSPGLLWCCGVWLGWEHPDAPQQHSDSTCLTTSAEHPDNTNSSSMIGLFNGSENNALNHKSTHTKKNSFSAKQIKSLLKSIKERERDITLNQHKFKNRGNVVPFSKC